MVGTKNMFLKKEDLTVMGEEKMNPEVPEIDPEITVETINSGVESGGKKKKTVPAEPKWVIAKLVLGILSFFLFVLVMFQSCAAGLGNALADNGEVSGSAGFLCAVNLLVSGLIAVIARKSVKKAPMIVAGVLLWLNLFYAKIMAGSYSDLVIWGYLSFIFGAVYLFSVMRTKKEYLITAIVGAVFLVLTGVMGMGTGNVSSTGTSSASNGSVQTASAAQESDISDEEDAEAEAAPDTEAASQDAADNMESVSPNEAGAEAWEVGEGGVNTYEDSIGTNWIQIAVPVQNTGSTNLYLSAGTMDLEDADGHLIDSKSLVSVYPEVIKPGEVAWYYDDTTLDSAPSSPLKVVPRVDVATAKVDCIRYTTSDVSFSDEGYGRIKVTGRVENTTDQPGSMIKVVILMYDAEENFRGVISTYLDGDLNPGDKAGFSASSLGSNGNLQLDDVANYRIYAYPTQFQF